MRKIYEETGKYFYDVSKVVLAIGGLTPFFNGGKFSFSVVFVAGLLWASGTYIYYLGGKK